MRNHIVPEGSLNLIKMCESLPSLVGDLSRMGITYEVGFGLFLSAQVQLRACTSQAIMRAPPLNIHLKLSQKEAHSPLFTGWGVSFLSYSQVVLICSK